MVDDFLYGTLLGYLSGGCLIIWLHVKGHILSEAVKNPIESGVSQYVTAVSAKVIPCFTHYSYKQNTPQFY